MHIFEKKVKFISYELVKAIMAKQGRKIAQIKVVREMAGMDLKDSKEFIDGLWENYIEERGEIGE